MPAETSSSGSVFSAVVTIKVHVADDGRDVDKFM